MEWGGAIDHAEVVGGGLEGAGEWTAWVWVYYVNFLR